MISYSHGCKIEQPDAQQHNGMIFFRTNMHVEYVVTRVLLVFGNSFPYREVAHYIKECGPEALLFAGIPKGMSILKPSKTLTSIERK